MQSIAAKYEAENPNVDIECIYIPNADYTTKMTAMIASGDEPDIANLFPSDFIGWAEQGRFVNLYEMLENDDRYSCLLYTSPSPRDRQKSRMPSSA